MGQLTVIRHAQASLMKADYDQLSDLGHLQAQKLAQHLVDRNIRFDKIYLGQLKRHRQTADHIRAAYQHQNWDCEYIALSEFNEHQSPKVARWMLERVLSDEQSEELNYYRAILPKADADYPKKQYLALFDLVSIAWAKGEIDARRIDVEPFATFRKRVEQGLQRVINDSQRKANIAIVTSGGPTAVSVGKALNLPDGKAMELNGIVRNSAMTRFLFDEQRFSLHAFNTTPHLDEARFLTYV
ncbi:MAG: histidine phosphatase family protein [Bacteroidota bacterium]